MLSAPTMDDVAKVARDVVAVVNTSYDLVEQLQRMAEAADDTYEQMLDDVIGTGNYSATRETRRELLEVARECRQLIWQVKTAGQGQKSI